MMYDLKNTSGITTTGTPFSETFTTVAGQLTYTLTEEPNSVLPMSLRYNGIEIEFSRVGRDITIITYTADEVDAGNLLRISYYKA